MGQENQKAPITITAVGLTDVGRVREHNEDSFLVVDPRTGALLGNGELLECQLSDTPLILAVADGMGGAAAGEIASRMAIERFKENLGADELKGASPDQIDAQIDQALQQANSEIKQEGEDNPERKGMGTTFTSVVAADGRMFIAQVGDSRGYLLRKGTFVRLTRDQSLKEQLIEEGTLTPEEAEHFGGGNIILQALGVEDRVRPDTKQHEVLRGDLLLLCSDGLSGMIDDAAMEAIVKEFGDDLPKAVQKLIDAANEGGGRDNISVVLARFDGEGLRPPLGAVTADDISKAGNVFAAPPPPDVPNPMKKVGLALGLIIAAILVAWGLLLRTDAKLTVAVLSHGGEQTVTLTDDSDGHTLAHEISDGGTLVFPKVPSGAQYTLVVDSPGHFTYTKKLDVVAAADLVERVHLRGRPGTVEVSSAIAHVKFVVKPSGSGHPEEQVTDLDGSFDANLSTPRPFKNVPPGEVKVTATRQGFEDFSETVTLAPEGEVSVTITGMEPVHGRLEVACAVSGFRVRVKDRYGDDLLDAPLSTDAGKKAAAELRVGDHVLEYELDGFESGSMDISVLAGQTTAVTIEPRQSTVQVTLVAATGGRGELFRKSGGGEWERVPELRKISLGGGSERHLQLVPGAYMIEFAPVGGDVIKKTFDVRRGSPGEKVRIGR